jgi:hypothetical protein
MQVDNIKVTRCCIRGIWVKYDVCSEERKTNIIHLRYIGKSRKLMVNGKKNQIKKHLHFWIFHNITYPYSRSRNRRSAYILRKN